MNAPDFVQGLGKLEFQDENIPIHRVNGPTGEICFVMYGETTEFRVRTLFTKEPETIEWIDGFDEGEVLWDIGANIGCYSMYAASRNIFAYAFEPSPINFWLLTENSIINNFGDYVVVLPFALSDTTGMALWSPNKRAGSANNQLNVSGNMAVQTYRIDDLVQQLNMPFPNHIKIDVDGIECLILSGGVKTLSDIRVKSLIVEVDERNEEQVDCVVDELKACGFGEPVTRHSPYFEKNYYLPSCNYLFTRK